MSGGLLSLKWNNHQSTFLHVLSSLCLNDTLSDVTLACDGEFYAAHKLVLATCSEYFEKIFEKIEGKHSVIVLKDVKAEELEALLNYMYEGEVNVLQEKLSGLIKAAEYLKVKGLSDSDESPELFSRQIFKRSRRRGKVGSSKEQSASPPAKRKRQDTECSDSSIKADSFSDATHLNSLQKRNVCGPEIIESPVAPEESSFHNENQILGLSQIKDEPDIELKTEALAFNEESSQAANEHENYIPQTSEVPGPALLETEKSPSDTFVEEGSSTSSNLWDSGTDFPSLSNSNRITISQSLLKDKGGGFPEAFSWQSTSRFHGAPLLPPNVSPFNDVMTGSGRSSWKGNKNIVCTVCSKSFQFQSHLRKHHLIHTGETPFACTLCSYRTNRRENLNRHIRNHKKNQINSLTFTTQINPD